LFILGYIPKGRDHNLITFSELLASEKAI